jgi:hypothetical protein
MSVFATFLIFALIFWVAPAYLVYVHAKNRGRDAGLWAAVVLVGGLLGILLYFILADSGGSRGGAYGQAGRGTRGQAGGGAHGQAGSRGTAGGGGQTGGSWNIDQPQGDRNQTGSWEQNVGCPQCGATNDRLANYCGNCGAALQS